MTKLSWTGFSKKTPQERKEHLKKNALLSVQPEVADYRESGGNLQKDR